MITFRARYPVPTSRWEEPIAETGGILITLLLFVCIPLTQFLGEVTRPQMELTEEVVAFDIPKVEIEEFDHEEAVAEEPPPELEENLMPNLTLDQLDMAFNAGAGESAGELQGDFVGLGQFTLALAPSTTDQNFSTTDIVDFAELDQLPAPLPGHQLRFPRRLLRVPAQGRIVLRLVLAPDGEVLEAEIHRSDLPAFERIVVAQVETWQFTAPTRLGKPVTAYAHFPIPISIK